MSFFLVEMKSLIVLFLLPEDQWVTLREVIHSIRQDTERKTEIFKWWNFTFTLYSFCDFHRIWNWIILNFINSHITVIELHYITRIIYFNKRVCNEILPAWVVFDSYQWHIRWFMLCLDLSWILLDEFMFSLTKLTKVLIFSLVSYAAISLPTLKLILKAQEML